MHEHPAEPAKIKITKSINKIKETAKYFGTNPSKIIYANVVSQLDEYSKERIPVEEALKRTIRILLTQQHPDELEILVST